MNNHIILKIEESNVFKLSSILILYKKNIVSIILNKLITSFTSYLFLYQTVFSVETLGRSSYRLWIFFLKFFIARMGEF